MTQVLKHEGDHSRAVRPLDVQAPAKAPTAEERRIAALHANVEELQQSLRDAEARRLVDIETAHTMGRDEAAAAFLRSEDEKLAVLKTGVERAVTGLDR